MSNGVRPRTFYLSLDSGSERPTFSWKGTHRRTVSLRRSRVHKPTSTGYHKCMKRAREEKRMQNKEQGVFWGNSSPVSKTGDSLPSRVEITLWVNGAAHQLFIDTR